MSTFERHAEQVSGEVAGKHAFRAAAGPGWTFALIPVDTGWAIRVYDADGLDLTQMTPPFHGPNPRDVLGWHFRNAANNGVNRSDVNAPQHLREFFVTPALTGTGGYRPPRSGQPSRNPHELPSTFRITDIGLADLDEGQQARANYLAFRACLAWPKSAEESSRERDRADPEYTESEREIFAACGLDVGTYDLDAWVLPRTLEGDLDGDGAIDSVAPVRRRSDSKRAIAVCLAGTRLALLGADEPVPGTDGRLSPEYFELIEAWRIGPIDAAPHYVGEAERPGVPGDVLTVERIEKSSYLIYREGDSFAGFEQYVFVEP